MHLNALVTLFLSAALGTSIASCSGDALTQSDCPGTPTDLKTNVVAPFWGGLVELQYKVPDGAPGGVEVQAYDSYLKIWTPSSNMQNGGVAQQDGGDYVSLLSVSVTKENRDLDQKMRIRTVLEGCAPSDWAESKAFKATNPFIGTTWESHFAPNEVQGNIQITDLSGLGSAVGPYHLVNTSLDHKVHFGSQNDVEEDIAFTIASDHGGDPYDNCHFEAHFAGTYSFSPENSLISVGERHLTADPASGSSCADPIVQTMALRMPGAVLPSTGFYTYGIDYSGLLASPPGGARWSGGLTSSISSMIGLLSVSGGAESFAVSSGIDVSSGDYLKQ